MVTECPVPGLNVNPYLISLDVAQALKVHQEVNCLTDFLEECEEQLQALKKLKKSERGLLYGVPMSLKDPYDCMVSPGVYMLRYMYVGCTHATEPVNI